MGGIFRFSFDLIASMLECELFKHSQSGILSGPVGEWGPPVDAQVHKYPWCMSLIFHKYSDYNL